MIRVKNVKKVKNYVKFYKNSFNMVPPYLIICDPFFIKESIIKKINLIKSFSDIFKDKIYLKVTDCCMNYVKGKKTFAETLKFCEKDCQLFKCRSHRIGDPIDCLEDNLKKFNGAIATQNFKLRKMINVNYPSIPVFYVDQGLKIVPPSKKTKDEIMESIKEKYVYKEKDDEVIEKPVIEEPQQHNDDAIEESDQQKNSDDDNNA